uniref:Adipose-secreted signaling protein n=1 Tax=Meleagris gallopavo TaxID=9103 RepID=H9H2F2_MELGA
GAAAWCSKAKAGAVRFAPSQPGEGNPGHVHFDEKLRDSAVMVTQERDGHVLVKVGFLKILHKYEITFLLPPSQRLGRDVCALPLPNPNLKVLGVTAVPEGYSVRCEYTAHKEGVLKEEMLLATVGTCGFGYETKSSREVNNKCQLNTRQGSVCLHPNGDVGLQGVELRDTELQGVEPRDVGLQGGKPGDVGLQGVGLQDVGL